MVSYHHGDEVTDVILSAGVLLSFTLGMATAKTKTLCLQGRVLPILILIFFPQELVSSEAMHCLSLQRAPMYLACLPGINTGQ